METRTSNPKMRVLHGGALSGVVTFNINPSSVYAFEETTEPEITARHLFTDDFACNRQCMTCVRHKTLSVLSQDL